MTAWPYYPGCALHATSREYDVSTRALCRLLDIQLEELKGWICCGATLAASRSETLALALPIYNLIALRRRGGTRLAVPCAACFYSLRNAAHRVANAAGAAEQVAEAVGEHYDGGVEVVHLLEVVGHAFSPGQFRERTVRPLTGISLASYYGCLLTRPPEVTEMGDYEHPTVMDDLVEAVGAQAVDWDYKTECCGAALTLGAPEVGLERVHLILWQAQEAGAQALVVACPLCQSNLDLRQPEVERRYGRSFNLPVLYFTQVLGMALGLDPRQLGIDRHLVSFLPVLEEAERRHRA